ncbi:POK9 protein, partial [Machaerirhynchus nigripectus]|nr:POK9 protein [Machaerirhynchus nigripectus]
SGSTKVDLETAVEATLTDSSVRLIDSNVSGPLGNGLSAFLLGRSSSTRMGLEVVPGVIDSDCTGVVKITVRTLYPPVTIPKGSKIAQLVPFRACVPSAGNKERGDQGFGSTGQPEIYWAMDITRGKPNARVKITHPNGDSTFCQMMIDTGADVTLLS